MLDQQTLPVFLGQSHWPPLPNLLQAAAGNKWDTYWLNSSSGDFFGASFGRLRFVWMGSCRSNTTFTWHKSLLALQPGAASSGHAIPPKRVMLPLHCPLEQDQLAQVIGLSLGNN